MNSVDHVVDTLIHLCVVFPLLEFQKKIAVFHFLSAISEKQESTISEGLKFKVSSYRILKIQKTISLVKVSLKKQFNLIDLSCCGKYN